MLPCPWDHSGSYKERSCNQMQLWTSCRYPLRTYSCASCHLRSCLKCNNVLKQDLVVVNISRPALAAQSKLVWRDKVCTTYTSKGNAFSLLSSLDQAVLMYSVRYSISSVAAQTLCTDCAHSRLHCQRVSAASFLSCSKSQHTRLRLYPHADLFITAC